MAVSMDAASTRTRSTFGGMTVFTVLALAVILEVIEGAPAAVQVMIALAALIRRARSESVSFNQLITLLMPPRLLSKLELRDDGIPEDT